MRTIPSKRAVTALITAGVSLALAVSAAPLATAWPNGDSSPTRTLTGASTRLGLPYGVLLDGSNRLVVSNVSAVSITAYALPLSDGAAPVDEMTWSEMGTSYIGGLAQDSSGRLYAAGSFSHKVLVFDANWIGGGHTPVKVLTGPNTGLSDPSAIAFDAAGLMYVANRGSNAITVYSADWATGNTAPLRTLQGPSTGLISPQGLAFSPDGLLMVANYSGGTVTAYAADASGDTAPIKATGLPLGTFNPSAIVFDADGRMSVTDWSENRVVTFAPGWADGALAWRELKGPNTALNFPGAMALSSTGELFVANYGSNTVTTYPAIPRVPGAPTAVRATAGPDGTASVTWVAPTSAGGSAITGYRVIPSSGASGCDWGLSSGPLTCTVSGLRLGTSYTFTVIATNSEGDSDPSRPSRAVTPLPAAPTVSAVRPASLPAGAARSITITGTGFLARHMSVSLRTVGRKFACTKVQVVSSTSLTCLAPALGVGSYAVSVGFTDYAVAGGSKASALRVVRSPKR